MSFAMLPPIAFEKSSLKYETNQKLLNVFFVEKLEQRIMIKLFCVIVLSIHSSNKSSKNLLLATCYQNVTTSSTFPGSANVKMFIGGSSSIFLSFRSKAFLNFVVICVQRQLILFECFKNLISQQFYFSK